jgi:rod shape determining protein RodA
MREGSRVRDFDWQLLLISLAICGLGLMQIYSATHATRLAGMEWRQFWWIVLGLIAMAIVARLDYHTVLEQAPLLYLTGLGLLVLVLVAGTVKFGARRWLSPGGFDFQVSELVKLVIIIVLARFYSEVRTERLAPSDLAKVGVLTGIPILLILRQPDLGTALVLIPVAAVGAFLAGVEWKHAVALLLVAVLLLPIGWHFLKPYQKDRIETFLNPSDDPRGSGYQVLQSKIAVGSGGFWGKGFAQGSQNQGGFLPVRWADFILAALAEERGFFGVLVTLLLYLALLLRLVQNARSANDRAGMYLVMGVAAVLGFHVLVNVAMVIGYMPVTGLPLPLMSYGGSATMFMFLALGLVMSVRMRRFVN